MKRKSAIRKFFQFILAIIIAFIPYFFSLIFSPINQSEPWYAAMQRSALTPPGWLFGVAWTILYILNGIAFYLVISSKKGPGKLCAAILFSIQILLNILWIYLFFGTGLVTVGLIILIATLGFAIWMVRAFYRVSKGAAYLLLPYIAWSIFALYLNFVIVYLN